MAGKMSANAEAVVASAHDEAKALGSMNVEPEHLLLSVLAQEESGASRLLTRMGLAAAPLREHLAPTCKKLASPTGGAKQSITTREALCRAIRESNRLQATEVRTEHLLLGLVEDMGHAGKFLKAVGLSLQSVRLEAAKMRNDERIAKKQELAATAPI